ncbi:MAG: asparagine synthase (glutamine-hydrolyzing) [Acidobacteriota bacterium]
MCGIAGRVGNRADGAERLRPMLDRLKHRGPDDEGCHIEDGVALGQRRLSIIDLAGGHQPIHNEDRTVWVVCNGEIYNHESLRAELIEAGHRFSTRSDCEVLVHLYEDLGERSVERLRGMFAFAIWDGPRRRLFAARDHLGQKPFYYVHGAGNLAFASEIKALLAADPSLAELDLEALHQYLALRIIAPPRSMFQRIRKLPPGHWLMFSPGADLTIRRYWDLDFEPKHRGSEEELTEELERRLVDSLRAHMVSDVPVGAFLSGGVDSSLVVALLSKHVVSEPLKTFTIGLPYRNFDEAPPARQVADRYGTEHHAETVRPSLVSTLPRLVNLLDEPSDPLSICTYLIARMARAHVKVVVGGDGGDELFGGYDRYYGNRYAGIYAHLPVAVRKHILGPVLRRLPDGNWYKSRLHQMKWLHEASFLDGSARYAATLGYFYFNGSRRDGLYGPPLADAAEAFDPGSSIRAPYERARARDPLDRMLYADSQVRLPDHSVMILDRMTMAHGLEARSPFMDHELAEFCARLPVRLKVRGRRRRYIQMRLARRHLPDDFLTRPKQGFSSALPYMLHTEYRLLEKAFLRTSHLARDGILMQPAVDRLLAAQSAGQTDHGNRLWLLVNTEVWYRLFMEGCSEGDLHEVLERAKGADVPAA